MDEFNSFTDKYEPKTINDIVFHSDLSKRKIMEIVNRQIQFPSSKNGILLYGKYGTGKTKLARLLPDAIEIANGGTNNPYYRWEPIGTGNDGAKVVSSIESESMLYPYGVYRYFVLDEFDRLKPEVMRSFKQIMNRSQCVFIFTTNDISKIDEGVLSRCVKVEFNAAPAEAWLPKVKAILANHGVSRSDANLLAAINTCKGDAREILYTAQMIIAHDLAIAGQQVSFQTTVAV